MAHSHVAAASLSSVETLVLKRCAHKLKSVLQVKMVTADDDSTTDIVVEGDQEEVTRMSKELQLVEKGKVYVKGLLE